MPFNLAEQRKCTCQVGENHFHQHEWYDMTAAVDMFCIELFLDQQGFKEQGPSYTVVEDKTPHTPMKESTELSCFCMLLF